MKTLLIGGARSGKSALAERLATDSARPVTLIATAQAGDDEMAARIAAHRAQRPPHWRVIEEPLALAEALRAADTPGGCVLVDCLTLWLSNLLLADEAMPTQPGPRFVQERQALLAQLPTLQSDLLLIGNEVGHGIVPLGPLNRLFVDENGRLHQALAAHCERVRFVMAGCVLALKG
jgi:adenosylcobinamide kinase / adenosylcobinamide-phosphate guanylyltransferase